MELTPFSPSELEMLDASLLPDRQALFNFLVGVIGVLASNSSVAANVFTIGSIAASSATQVIEIG